MISPIRLPHRRFGTALLMIFSLLCFQAPAQDLSATPTGTLNYKFDVDGTNSFNFAIKDVNGAVALTTTLIGWAPDFKWVGILPPTTKGTSDDMTLTSTFTVDNTPDTTINITAESTPTGTGGAYKYTLTSTKDIPITSIVTEIMAPEDQTTGTLTIVAQSTTDYPLPIKSAETTSLVSKAIFHLAGGDVVIDIDPPASIALRTTGFRLLLAADLFKAGAATTTVTYSFPSSAK